ncbi:helix-turn-helix domain-containing protein [Cohnella candidum]|uniref:DNA-binding protein n=1 Tax=Cohnella candidum TaxID=2674991 RepID=A0A3G3K3X0_9BACL|nr:helix-turn-helix domain-containing protein [Cohnella candidum]AYQ74459.1 DNA-binding protein [Cohnella candidum]
MDRNDDIDTFVDEVYRRETNNEAGDGDMTLISMRNASDAKWVTTGQAAKLLGVSSVNTIKRWVAEGKLQAIKPGNRVMISYESIKDLLDAGDKELIRKQQLLKALDELDEAFGTELSGDELDSLSMRNYSTDNKLPWEK